MPSLSSCRQEVAEPGRRLAPHFHDEANLILVSRGEARVRLGWRSFVLKAPALVWIPGGEAHACNADPRGSLAYEVFPMASPRPQAPAAEICAQAIPLSQEALEEVKPRLLAFRQGTSPGQVIGSELASWLLGIFPSRKASRDLPPLGGTLLEGADDLAALVLDRNPYRPLLLGAVAAELGLSPSGFTRAFRSRLDLCPGEFLAACRVNRAKALIKEGLSLAEVAGECGFCDQSHFSRTFKRVTGQSPGSFAATLGAS